MKRKLIGASLLDPSSAGIGYYTLDLYLLPDKFAAAPNSHSENDGHKHGDEGAQEGQRDGDQEHEGEEGTVHLTEAKIARAGIAIIEAKAGEVSKEEIGRASGRESGCQNV